MSEVGLFFLGMLAPYAIKVVEALVIYFRRVLENRDA
jgi:hypothetical protein